MQDRSVLIVSVGTGVKEVCLLISLEERLWAKNN